MPPSGVLPVCCLMYTRLTALDQYHSLGALSVPVRVWRQVRSELNTRNLPRSIGERPLNHLSGLGDRAAESESNPRVIANSADLYQFAACCIGDETCLYV